MVVFELIVLAGISAFLYARGWRVSRFCPSISASDFGAAVFLAVVAETLYLLVSFVAATLDPTTAASAGATSFVRADLTIGSIVAVSIVNPVFEEFILCGYVVTVLKERRGFWFAVNVSLAIRPTCHLYQGPVGVISILPLGFAFTYWYARTGRLWPVILAHALFDVVGLWPYLSDDVI